MTQKPFPRRAGACLLGIALATGVHTALRAQNLTTGPATTAGTAPAPMYSINLSPPNVVGQKFHLVTDYAQKINLNTDASLLGISLVNEKRKENSARHLEAEAEVLDIFPNGSIKKISLRIIRLATTVDGNTTIRMPAGTKVVLDKIEPPPPLPPVEKTTVTYGDKGRAVISITKEQARPVEPSVNVVAYGAAMDEKLGGLLASLAPLGSGKSTQQEYLAPPGPVAVGATWPLKDAEAMWATLQARGIAKAITKSSGPPVTIVSQLDAVEGTGDRQVATVSTTFTLKDVKELTGGKTTDDTAILRFTGNQTVTIPATRTFGVETATTHGKFLIKEEGRALGTGAKIDGEGEMRSTTVKTYH